MNRIEYMSQLDDSLKCLPEQERREAVEFYYNYFEDAHESGKTDEEIIEELGPVSRTTAKIISQCNFVAKSTASKEAFNEARGHSTVSKGIKGVLLAIGAVIIGLPGAFIIGIPVLAVLLSLLVTALALIFALGVVMIVLPIAFIIAAVCCFASMPGSGIVGFGLGLIFIGVALLTGTVLYLIIYCIIKGISMLVNLIMRSFTNRRRQRAATA